MTLIQVQTAAVTDAISQIKAAYTQTQQNYDQSVQILQSNPDVFGGQGSEAFSQVYSTLNSQYQEAANTIQRAGQALGVALDSFHETDGQCASQYNAC